MAREVRTRTLTLWGQVEDGTRSLISLTWVAGLFNLTAPHSLIRGVLNLLHREMTGFELDLTFDTWPVNAALVVRAT